MKANGLFFIKLLLCIPLAGIFTLILYPLWGWIEAATGIESFGHSGPATWCFVATYAIFCTALFILKKLESK